jgi:PPIC-type PPIASE domain
MSSRVGRLSGALAFGMACQQSAQPATPPAAAAATEAIVAPGDPVITLEGFCADSGGQGGACRTVITRAQFDKLVEALQPGMPLPLRLAVANAYARNLKMSAAAEQRGLDKTPEFQEEMRYARMQLLAQDLNHALQREADNISDEDVRTYYRQNQASYEQASVARIFIPHSKYEATLAQKSAAESEMTRVAAELRGRAVSGEDPDKLQVEAYRRAGIARDTVSTHIEKIRRAGLPPAHEAVMDLKAGEVSEVLSDPQGAHFIYKMLSKRTLDIEEARPEIRAAISSQRYRAATKNYQGDAVFNDAYFNPSGNSAAAPSRHDHIAHVH